MGRKFYRVTGYEEVNLPQRQTKSSAGYDFESAQDVTIKPHEIVLVPTGIKTEMNSDEVLLIFPRSSLGKKKGLMLSNSVGVIDSDYFNNPDNEGHIFIALLNFKESEAVIKKGERIAQGIFLKYLKTDDDVSGGQRLGGIGSTDKTK